MHALINMDKNVLQSPNYVLCGIVLTLHEILGHIHKANMTLYFMLYEPPLHKFQRCRNILQNFLHLGKVEPAIAEHSAHL